MNTHAYRRYLLTSIALLLGLVVLTTAARAAETTVTVKNRSDRAVAVSTQANAHSSIVKYCVASFSETHLRGVRVVLVTFMEEGRDCFGAAAKEYRAGGTAQLIEAEGTHGKYWMIER